MKEHRFWSNQPVSVPENAKNEVNEPVTSNCDMSKISTKPINLPNGFEWTVLDILQPPILKEFCDFLKDNYIEDETCTFKLQYSEPILLWALTPPGYFPECIRCVRLENTGKIVATIAATPEQILIRGKKVDIVFVNFLCVEKSLRSKRLSPVLIKEITRLANLRGIFQALHTGAIVLPTSLCAATYYHRFLNPKKLVTSGFGRIPENIKASLYYKLHKTPSVSTVHGFRPMRPDDAVGVTRLFNTYQSKFKLSKVFTEEYARACLVPQAGVLYSYVVEVS